MHSVLRPATSRTTWTRVLHLAIGLWVAAACAMVWPGLEDTSPATLAGLALAPLPLLVLLAAVPVVRRSEGVQARALVLPGDDDVTVEPSRSWSDRARLLAWLVVRVELGVLAGQLTAVTVAAGWSLLGLPSARWPAASVPGWAGLPLALLLVVALVYALAALGGLLAAAARHLLHPSAAERLAAQRARTERLLERTRLAAELHDSIGHALTVTLLQAGAAREVASRDPAFVDGALRAIEDCARQATDDLERVLGLLRDTTRPPVATPTLADLDRLVRSAEAAGAQVELHVTGEVADLPGQLSEEGYRIVQEALTNALRHAGPVPVRLQVEMHGGGLVVDVRNPIPAALPATAGTGSGVPGLQHRAAALGGTVEAGRVDGGWRVAVRLPVPG
ncbi:histidine kinase [Modestobacter sp. VKM Ac-2979]|uniref:sensor histidine kinase n=1 Tax=unclassified Modestobacter TaxID=2643866 RepID=UPI0022ABB6F5|nr:MULTISPECIES: histidine kinase [unclassified Modestobacter]MCZ2810165.1 histidine kinase [Modestobacter sp. VKM Ac-2979]MCZ2841651.1 histidine kinase [Modestobacter sp. VKM Ac-2980]